MTSENKNLQTESSLGITPDLRIGKLLSAYPQLEEVLLSLSPEFARLKNPILRKTVGKIASLRQVAQVGNVPLAVLINRLREEVGQQTDAAEEVITTNESTAPAWWQADKIVRSLDARPIIDSGGHPVEQVMRELKNLTSSQIYELVTPFIPAPLIDLAKGK